jgi:hypothetical protein
MAYAQTASFPKARCRRMAEEAAPIAGGDMAANAGRLANASKRDFTPTMQLLRESCFQKLLTECPRKKDAFLVAIGEQDTVMTEWLLRDAQAARLSRPAIWRCLPTS